VAPDIAWEPPPDLVLVEDPGDDRSLRDRCADAAKLAADAGVIIVSERSDGATVELALANGATGYVIAGELEQTLPVAVAGVRLSQVVAPRSLRQQRALPTLSNRERQVLAMLVLGLSNPEIAQKLFVTEATVKSHLSSCYRKLAVRSRSEAIAALLDTERGLGTGILRLDVAERLD